MTNKTKKLILVVDDDNDTRLTLVTMLEALNYEAVACGSAKEALEVLPTRKFDLALLDIMMPVMNGYELLNRLRLIPGYSKTPVIMVTAKDRESEVMEGYQVGADYYITKPFTAKQLEYGLKLYLDDQQQQSD